MFFFYGNIIKTSIHIIAFVLSFLFLVSCSNLQSGVTSFSEKVKETFHLKKKTTVTASYLNLRKAPSPRSRVLSVLRKGDELEVDRLSGKWAKVKTSDDREGWVYARYITGFEELFTEKQHTTEPQKSTSKPENQKVKSQMETPVKQEVASDHRKKQDTKETQGSQGSTAPPPSLPVARSGDNNPPDNRDTPGHQAPVTEIKTAEIPASPVSESSKGAEGETASIQRDKKTMDESGPFVFSHPQGLFSLQLPMGWENRKDSQGYFETYIFIDPSREMGIRVVQTSSEDYSGDEFYRDLASVLMERSGARTEISPSILRKTESGLEWLYGKVVIHSEPLRIREYWIKEHSGRLWAVVEAYPQTVSETASKRLSATRHSFSFGTKLDPNQ